MNGGRYDTELGEDAVFGATTKNSTPSTSETWSQSIEDLLSKVGASDVPVLLRGETGVGKEVVARKLHDRSARTGGPFLKVNCAALPRELTESELFGYERGAFTGAFKTTPGKFEMANGGTILLDEIGDMDFPLQAKLLQVLQDHEFLRLGAKDTSRVDIRVMSATHCDLEKAVSEGRFRQDLYYRLNIVEIHIPPLRERKDEILALARMFVEKHSVGKCVQLPEQLQSILLEHDWPGNIRELENVIRKFLVFKNTDIVADELRRAIKKTGRLVSRTGISSPAKESGFDQRAEDAASRQDASSWQDADGSDPLGNTNSSVTPIGRHAFGRSPRRVAALAEVDDARRKAEANAILAALNSTLWNRKQAAKLLNVEYKVLLYKMKKLRLGETYGEIEPDQKSSRNGAVSAPTPIVRGKRCEICRRSDISE
ncbi:MAG TPA: sigma 54-interacting transcriptional regulator [Bryobacteraceae bacterium]|nr:sigma 54-interacting transcriptional regulator [Bryobacteraceae bacterium]